LEQPQLLRFQAQQRAEEPSDKDVAAKHTTVYSSIYSSYVYVKE
jgi:hypothetical protein